MNATKIEYLNFTWSPLVGCSGVGCAVVKKCWAMYQAKRRKHKCQDCYSFKPHMHDERITQPFARKKPSIIGACYSADFWDNGFTMEQRELVMGGVTIADWHWFINLTKQTQNFPEYFTFPDNWIQGASICREADIYRVKDLWGCRAKHLALSIEPLYKRLPSLVLDDIDWVIIGAQTHPLKLPQKEWVDEIITKAGKQDIPVFIKNNLSSLGYFRQEYPSFLEKIVSPKETQSYMDKI